MKFSIVTVTRNNLSGLQATGDSLHVQTSRDFEWIVVDGASADGTVEYLTSQACPQPGEEGLRWLSEPDAGIYDAMNKGIARAQGDYLLFLNAGDTLATPDTLEKIKIFLADKNPDFIYGDSLEDNRIKKARSHKHILTGMITHHQAMLYKRQTAGNARYDKTFKIAADYKFTLQHLTKSREILYCPFPVCIFEQGGISQRQVKQGRVEQFKARKELKICALHLNAGIYCAQSLLMMLRRYVPQFYWALKRLVGLHNP